jgi:biotin operon repressor
MYEPRAGSHGARAIEHLQQAGAGAELTSAELAAALGIDEACLPQSINTARKHGLIVAERRGGRGLVWSLPQPEEEAEPAAFSAALWTDGAQVNEGGSFTLSPDQVAEVRRLITRAEPV